MWAYIQMQIQGDRILKFTPSVETSYNCAMRRAIFEISQTVRR